MGTWIDNRVVTSSVKRDAQHDFDQIWLTGRLIANFKTVPNFRNGSGSSKLKTGTNLDKNFTDRKLQACIGKLERGIACYIDELDTSNAYTPTSLFIASRKT
jgi:hypothetical protein